MQRVRTMTAKEFNDLYQTGCVFTYNSVKDKSKAVCVTTTSLAWEENNQTVVEVEGKQGCLPVSRFKECQ